MLFNSLKSFYSDYEMPLARVLHEVDRRGVLVDPVRLVNYVTELDRRLASAIAKIEQPLGMKVIPKAPKGAKPTAGILNLSSPTQLRDVLLSLKIPLKKERGAKSESTNEESLQQAFAETGNPILKEILIVRELNKLRGTYALAETVDNILYTIFKATGTVGGRRSSSETPFTASNGRKIGTNLQNIPKQSELGKAFRHCLVSRPGMVFVECDQVSAEDWIVWGIIADASGSTRGIEELRAGIDRHQVLASKIFNKPKSECGHGTLFRFFGKKTRHAGNYDMQAYRMSIELAKEGFNMGVRYCDALLMGFHNAEPEIRGVFHRWVQDCIRDTRTLRTPIGRERYFFGLRPYADNSKIYKEAYSYVPQSTIGDNTGLAILVVEAARPWVILDTHDAVTLEVSDTVDSVIEACEILEKAFDREIVFPNGFTLKVPISYQIGYNLKDEVEFKCEEFKEHGSRLISATLDQCRKLHFTSTLGAPLPVSAPSSSVECG